MGCKCDSVARDERFDVIDRVIDVTGRDESMLIQILEQVQHKLGYLPEDVLSYLAEVMDIPLSNIYGVVTFYSLFTTEPIGKHIINVCMGTACYVLGAGDILSEFERLLDVKVGETTQDGLFTLRACRCIGCCGLAPVLTVSGKVFGNMVVGNVHKIIDGYKQSNSEEAAT